MAGQHEGRKGSGWGNRNGLTTHSTGRAISLPFIENSGGFGGLRAPVNSGVGRYRFVEGRNLNMSKMRGDAAFKHAQKLREAVSIAIEKAESEDVRVSEILGYGEVFEGVENLDMQVSALSFPDMRAGSSKIFGFTWEWIAANDLIAIAEEVLEQVREAMTEGDLPQAASEFLVA